MSLVIQFNFCKAAYPLNTGTANVQRMQGREIQFPSFSTNLGGINSGLYMPPENHLPLVNSVMLTSIPWSPPGQGPFALHKIFRDITAAEASAGVTLYRGLFIVPSRACTDLKVWSSGGPAAGAIMLGTETVNTISTSGAKYVQRIATETSAPSGVVFGSYTTSGAALSLGSVSENGVVFLWVKLVVSAGSTPTMYDVFNLSFSDGADSTMKISYHTVQKGVSSASVTGLQDGGIVQHPYGDTYTVKVYDSSNVLADPPSSTVMCYAASSKNSTPFMGYNFGQNVSGSFVNQCVRQSTGVYQLEFKPLAPGHYFLTFDCGGEVQTTRNVEVSPVV